MRTRVWLFSFVAFLTAGQSILALPVLGEELYQYQITSYPKTLLGCMETAQWLAKNFSDSTGKKVYQVRCNKEDWKSYDIGLVYLSASALNLVSTSNERNGSLGDLGIYRSLEECNKNLPQEIEWFEKYTELSHSIAYCTESSLAGATPFFPRIDGFGIAKRYPSRYEGFISGGFLDEAGTITREIFEKSSLAGAPVTTTTYASGGSDKLVIRFYDTPENALHQLYYFSTAEVARFFSYSSKEALEHCHLEMSEAKKTYGQKFDAKSVWFCTWNASFFRAGLQVFRVTPFTRWAPPFETAPDYFKDFSECRANKEKIVDFYKTELGKDVVGAICTWENNFGASTGNYQLRIFTKPESSPLVHGETL